MRETLGVTGLWSIHVQAAGAGETQKEKAPGKDLGGVDALQLRGLPFPLAAVWTP